MGLGGTGASVALRQKFFPEDGGHLVHDRNVEEDGVHIHGRTTMHLAGQTCDVLHTT
jgi:hypothetical protein